MFSTIGIEHSLLGMVFYENSDFSIIIRQRDFMETSF